MCWKKMGLLFSPESIHPKLISHAANPLAMLLEGDIYRVYYSGRDASNRSSVGFVDIDIVKRHVVYRHDKPVFEYGPKNSFYSHGVSIGNCYEVDGRHYLLFMGWRWPPGEHWFGEIGQLIINSDLSLSIVDRNPLMAIDSVDGISLSYPWVNKDNGRYHMWYGSTVTWDAGNGEMLHVINHATSADGREWTRHGLAIPFAIGIAQAFSRPTVIKDVNGFHMWFSYRSGTGQKYRIGYAKSANGIQWELKLNEAGIDVSGEGWDSEMIEYPFVFDHKGERYMLYNGNSYGYTGFGLAVKQ